MSNNFQSASSCCVFYSKILHLIVNACISFRCCPFATLHLQATAHCQRTRALSMLYNMNWSPYSANTHGVDNVLSSYSIKMLYSWRVWAPTPNVWIWKSGPTWCIMVDLSHHSMLEHAMRCVNVCLPVCLCVCVSVYLSVCLCMCLSHNPNHPVRLFVPSKCALIGHH